MTITGTGLTGATAVDFGSTPASSFTVNNDDSITAIDPAGTGTVDVTVTGPYGTSPTVATDKFTYVSLPAWLSLSGGGQVVWNAAAQTLEIQSGTATILADPNEVRFNSGVGDEPVITVDSGAKLEVAPTDGSLMVHIGGLTLNSGAAADVAQLEAPTATQLSNGQYVANDDASNHEALVIGKLDAASDPAFSLNANSTLDMENNDLIIHTGSSDPNGYTLLASVQAMAYGPGGGRNGGLWSGKGLTSTVAKNQDNSDGGESGSWRWSTTATWACPSAPGRSATPRRPLGPTTS